MVRNKTRDRIKTFNYQTCEEKKKFVLCKMSHQDLPDLWMLQGLKSLCPQSRIRDGRKQELTQSSHQDPALCPDCVHDSCHSPYPTLALVLFPHELHLFLLLPLCMLLSLVPSILVLISAVIWNILQMNSAVSTPSLLLIFVFFMYVLFF